MTMAKTTYNDQAQVTVKAGGPSGQEGAVAGANKAGISDAIFPDLLNEQVSKYGQFMGGADVLVPEKVLERPKRRLKAMQ